MAPYSQTREEGTMAQGCLSCISEDEKATTATVVGLGVREGETGAAVPVVAITLPVS